MRQCAYGTASDVFASNWIDRLHLEHGHAMMHVLRRAQKLMSPWLPHVPGGQRIYAIGDIHGCNDLLACLLAMIDGDDRARPPAQTTVVILGDFVDRGPDPAGVVARLIEEKRRRRAGMCILSGNHEELLLRSIRGDAKALRLLHGVGGRATFISYGLSAARYDEMDFAALADAVADLLPKDHVAFLDGLDSLALAGDYVFAHAGIRPGVPLDQQTDSDLRWIREPFLSARRNDRRVVVHGHTIMPTISVGKGRIGVDTGAYKTGILTAVGLEGSERWLLQATADGPVSHPLPASL